MPDSTGAPEDDEALLAATNGYLRALRPDDRHDLLKLAAEALEKLERGAGVFERSIQVRARGRGRGRGG